MIHSVRNFFPFGSIISLRWDSFKYIRQGFICISEVLDRCNYNISSMMHLSFCLWLVMLWNSLVKIIMLCLCKKSMISWNQTLLVQFLCLFDFDRNDYSTPVVSWYHYILDWIRFLCRLWKNSFRMNFIFRKLCSTFKSNISNPQYYICVFHISMVYANFYWILLLLSRKSGLFFGWSLVAYWWIDNGLGLF